MQTLWHFLSFSAEGDEEKGAKEIELEQLAKK